jgi:hypothetical protein
MNKLGSRLLLWGSHSGALDLQDRLFLASVVWGGPGPAETKIYRMYNKLENNVVCYSDVLFPDDEEYDAE